MGLRFTVLASGSGGNATLVESEDFGLLIDVGLGPRQLADRFSTAGLSWSCVKAVVLTHTHSDHWKDRTLAHLQARHIPLYCHPAHEGQLRTHAAAFPGLVAAKLVRFFEAGEVLQLAPGLRCRALPVRHDCGPTFGFRVEGPADLFGHGPSLAYVADLGTWDERLVESLADVDLLAVEFNHDEALERNSGRAPQLVARVLGDEGHLSNQQAAALLRATLARSPHGRLQHLVQLHLSRDCNRAPLAQEAAQTVLAELAPNATLHTAEQDAPGRTLQLSLLPPRPVSRRQTTRRQPRQPIRFIQPLLPGLGQEEA